MHFLISMELACFFPAVHNHITSDLQLVEDLCSSTRWCCISHYYTPSVLLYFWNISYILLWILITIPGAELCI